MPRIISTAAAEAQLKEAGVVVDDDAPFDPASVDPDERAAARAEFLATCPPLPVLPPGQKPPRHVLFLARRDAPLDDATRAVLDLLIEKEVASWSSR